MSDNIDISVIVPVYNADKHLKRCLDSIINQTYRNIEIILVNDGSTDSSREIIEEYAQKDERIIVVDKQNGGVSSARNKGIDIARGKYISFIDSDDYVYPNMYSSMINVTIDKNIDMVFCGFVQETQDHTRKVLLPGVEAKIFFEDDIRDNIINGLTHNHLMRSLVNKLFLNEIIQSNYLRLAEDIEFGEDYAFNIEYLMHIKSIYYVNECLYHYDNTTLGATNTGCKNLLVSGRLISDKLSLCGERWGVNSIRFKADIIGEYVFFARTQYKMIVNSDGMIDIKEQFEKAKEIATDKDFYSLITRDKPILFLVLLSKNLTSKLIILATFLHIPSLLFIKIWLNHITKKIFSSRHYSRQMQ